MPPISRAEQNAVGEFKLNPHPDGKPWDTCCGAKNNNACLCLMRKPRDNASRFTLIMNGGHWFWQFSKNVIDDLIKEKGRFFCCHRTTDDGFHRECAGWAAKFTKNGHQG